MCHATANSLVLKFDGGEVLTVTEPESLMVGIDVFTIHNAQSVRWEWFYYGRPAVAENLYFYEFSRRGLIIEARTNVDWHQPKLTPSTDENAVEIL
jgi:hypothetical protein